MNERSNYQYLFKYILIGSSSVGKTCILNNFAYNKFNTEYTQTLGVEYAGKCITVCNQKNDKINIKLQIWDTAGQQIFKSIARSYYKGSIGAILVYDITNQESFKDLDNWVYDLKAHSHENLRVILVGNKKDKEKQGEGIQKQIGQKYAKEHNFIKHFQSSAKTGENIQQIFMALSQDILGRIENGKINVQNYSSYGIKYGPKIKQKFASSSVEIIKQKGNKTEQSHQNCYC